MKSFEFGASLEWVLQIHSSFPKKIEKTQKNENVWVWIKFGESLENLQTHSKLTKKSLLDVMFQKACFFFKKKGTQKNICVHNLFLSGARIFFLKKNVHAYFFEFGESLEILQTHFFFQKSFQFWQLHQATLCEFGDSSNSLQTRSKLICFHFFCFIFYFTFVFLKRGMSLDQIRSKLICFHVFFTFSGKDEWVWSEVGGSPNSLQTHKLAPSSKGFLLLHLFGGKEEWVWNEFGDSPSSLQTQMISFVQCVFPLLFSSFLFGKDERLWSEFGVNLVHAYHPAKLVQVITMAWQKKTECCMGKLSINMNIVCINTILNLSNYQYVSINIAFNILYWHLSIWFWKQCILKTW